MKKFNEMTSKEFAYCIIDEINKKDIALPAPYWTGENVIREVMDLLRVAKGNGKRVAAVAKEILKYTEHTYSRDTVQSHGIAYIVFTALESLYTLDTRAINYGTPRELTGGDRESVKAMLKKVWNAA